MSAQRFSRRQFIGAAALAAAGASLAPARSQPAGRRPNVLIVFPDQWRRVSIGCYGATQMRTPNLDRLAAGGIRFDRCYATNPVCTPARAAMQTGRFPHQTGMINNDLLLPPGERGLACQLRDAGYATGYIGKWHLDGADKPGFVQPGPHRRGWEWFAGFNRGHWYPTGAQYFTDDGQLQNPAQFESVYQTDLALDFIRRNRERPWAMYLSWGPPHMPYRPTPEFDRWDRAALPWRDNVPESWRNDPAHRQQFAGYLGLCELLDVQFGRLLSCLEELNLTGNTLILFTSDHGDAHGSHGLIHKGHPEEESLGIPLLARLPGTIPAGASSQTLISHVDMLPSVLGLCGLSAPENTTGRDKSPVFRGQPLAVDSVYCEGRMTAMNARPARRNVSTNADEEAAPAAYGAWRTVVTDRYKLVVDTSLTPRRLSDLQEDPLEETNLAGKPEAQATERELLALLRDWGTRTADPFPQACTPAGA